MLHYMLRKLQPKRVIEIGCGSSSAAMLDTDELYLNGATRFHFIDPHPQRMQSFLREGDAERVTVWKMEVQDVDLKLFDQLDDGDLLFIDSSHVVKAGSDLQYIFFEVLPRLRSGVWIHLHDVRYPFEYSKETFDSRIFWNEAYFLRAFMMFNREFNVGLAQLPAEPGPANEGRAHVFPSAAARGGALRRGFGDGRREHLPEAPLIVVRLEQQLTRNSPLLQL